MVIQIYQLLNGSGGPTMVIIRGFDGSAASTNSTKDTLKIFVG